VIIVAKKDNVDSFDLICEKVDRVSPVYKNDTFWKAMKLGCDAIRQGDISEEAIAIVDKERRCWPSGSNRKLIDAVMEKMSV